MLKGTPTNPHPSGLDAQEQIEQCEDPHALSEFEGDPDAKKIFDKLL